MKKLTAVALLLLVLCVAAAAKERHSKQLRAKEKVNKIMNAVKLTEDEEKRYDSLKGSYDHKVEKCIKENCTHQPSKENGGIFKADDDPSARNVKECSSTCHRNAVKLTEDEEKRYDSLKGSYDHKVEKCIKENCTHQPSKENGGIFKADDDPSARNVKECSSTCHREARHDFTELWKLSDKRDCYELMRDYMELDNPKEAIKIYMLYKKHYFCNEVSLVTGGCDFPEP
ncbi:hypothetical protein M513_11608 [Trichuris suis]|uniref:Uncharacterized protein n=1 Tax=Trichuris suis TaxID=68888 RepID=A0A085LRB8_9BILA|nr:hypothetical protein M513_11608 [Trichuris suis]